MLRIQSSILQIEPHLVNKLSSNLIPATNSETFPWEMPRAQLIRYVWDVKRSSALESINFGGSHGIQHSYVITSGMTD